MCGICGDGSDASLAAAVRSVRGAFRTFVYNSCSKYTGGAVRFKAGGHLCA